MVSFYILTFGCRSNQADSAAIRESFLKSGMAERESFAEADIVVVNTCTVTHRYDKQARQAIRRVHRENPSARIVVAGCYAQRDAVASAKLDGVCLVAGIAEKTRIPYLLEAVKNFPNKKIFRSDDPITIENAVAGAPRNISSSFTNNLSQADALKTVHCAPPQDESLMQTRAGRLETHGIASPAPTASVKRLAGDRKRPLVKLQDGCDNHCAYCIVPSVRGSGRSVPPEDVLREIRSLIDAGFREIVLTGINLGAYGRRIKGHECLTDLLRRIIALPGIGRIRLSSVEPVFFDREIVRLACENPGLARHFHIPLQSGSDRILRLMRRPYTAARFKELLEFIHSELPDAGLGTDVITGFPGETDEDFEETRRFIKETPFSYLHVFPFSPREGTEAISLPGRIPSHIAKSRATEIINLARDKNLEFRRRFLGRSLSAITLSKEDAHGESVVLTHNFIHAWIPNLDVPPNRFVDVRVEEVCGDSTRASVAEQ